MQVLLAGQFFEVDFDAGRGIVARRRTSEPFETLESVERAKSDGVPPTLYGFVI